MVAAQHHQLAAGALQFHHEAVVQLAGIAGRRAGIEQISGDDQRIHLLLIYLFDQPVQKSLVLGGAAFGEKYWPRCQSEVWIRRMTLPDVKIMAMIIKAAAAAVPAQ